MPTDSTVRRQAIHLEAMRSPAHARMASLAFVAVLALQGVGCTKPPAVVIDDLLEPFAMPEPWMPGPGDLAAARLARAALLAKAPVGSGSQEIDPDTPAAAAPRVERALAEVQAAKLSNDQKHLALLAVDLRNATLDDPIAYRAGSRALRRKRGLDPRLRGRLDRTIGDDPLRLAGRRQFDGWHRLWARTFNSVAEPLGSSAITGFVLAPFQLANSLIHYVAEFSNSEPLSFTDRQALTLRQDFLAKHPQTSATPVLEKKIARDVILLEKTLAIRRVRGAEAALKAERPALAAHHARAAVNILSPHPEANGRTRKTAVGLIKTADTKRAEQTQLAARSLEATATQPYLREIEVRLAAALLVDSIRSESLEKLIFAYRNAGGSHVRGRVEFLRALVRHETGFEAAARDQLHRLAGVPADRDTMARHAHKLLSDDWQNPYGAFERLERKGAHDELAWRLAGEWVKRPRYPNLPVPVAYLIDTPTIALTIVLAPLRALISPWTGSPDFQRATALAGYRYLMRYPSGEEQRPVIDWLYDYETGKEHWGRALRMADWTREFSPEEREKLVEKAANQRLAQVEHLDRRDSRGSILRGVAQEFPDSAGGHLAGLKARAEREDASPQHIRITKEFLLENPTVAGPDGVGLKARLLNDDPADGELHPEGVVLRGGRVLEVRLIAEGKDHKDPPEPLVRKISPQRLARIAATLAEAVQLNSLIDSAARQAPDANRDSYLERAGLGLTEEVDVRAAAESSFVYLSLRERYGLVRGRDSVLPFDLVFRGSLGDFSLGAFPRWRPPRETPDAFLYR